MNTVKLKGAPIHLKGDFPQPGEQAKEFHLVKSDLHELTLSSLKGQKVVLNIFPSLDTAVCAMSIRKFNELVSKNDQTTVLAISKDLPFAHARFCATEGIEKVIGLSAFRCNTFGENYGVEMKDGLMSGLFARAVVIVNEEGQVIYSELVPEITQEPDYEKALKNLES